VCFARRVSTSVVQAGVQAFGGHSRIGSQNPAQRSLVPWNRDFLKNCRPPVECATGGDSADCCGRPATDVDRAFATPADVTAGADLAFATVAGVQTDVRLTIATTAVETMAVDGVLYNACSGCPSVRIALCSACRGDSHARTAVGNGCGRLPASWRGGCGHRRGGRAVGELFPTNYQPRRSRSHRMLRALVRAAAQSGRARLSGAFSNPRWIRVRKTHSPSGSAHSIECMVISATTSGSLEAATMARSSLK